MSWFLGSKRGPRVLAPRSSTLEAIDELALRAQAGKRGASDALAAAMQPHLSRVARRYARANGVEESDVYQDAAIGLMEALVRWRVGGGASFVTYASQWLHVYGRRTGQARVKVGTRNLEVREPDRCHASLQAPLHDFHAGKSELCLQDIVRDPEDLHERLEDLDRRRRVQKALRRLPREERAVLRGGLNGQTKREIAAQLERSVVWIGELERRALERMQKIFAEAA